MSKFEPGRSRVKGPPSYDEMRTISQATTQIAEALQKNGLPWSVVCVLRGITRTMCRLAGGYESLGRKAPGRGSFSLSGALRNATLRLESTYFLALYNVFDSARPSDELLVSPNALLEAWMLFTSQHPTHRLSIHHGWLLARDLLQKSLFLTRCKACGSVYLTASEEVRYELDYASLDYGCYVCERRRNVKTWSINQQRRQERAAEAARNRTRRRVAPNLSDMGGFPHCNKSAPLSSP